VIKRFVVAVSSAACLLALSLNNGGGATADPLSVRAPVHATLAEFARTRTRPSNERFVPRAWFSQAALTLRGRSAVPYALYVSAIEPSGAGVVDIFAAGRSGAHPPLIGQVTGLNSPSNIAIDLHGTLYVCQTNAGAPVLLFPLGAKTPSLALQTLGNLPVAVAVSPAGTVFVSTANANGLSAKILVYAPGKTLPAKQFSSLAGDAVGALQTDEHGNVYFAGDFMGAGNYIGEVSTAGAGRSLLKLSAPATGLELDRAGNLLAQTSALGIYAHESGQLLRTLSEGGAQSISFDVSEGSIYTATGTIRQYAYPSGALLQTITTLAADETFGIATSPPAPHGRSW